MESADPDKIILIDKPLGWTSFDVVKKLKFCLKLKKIGHAGTLDPLATGLLIVCTGKSTKKIPAIQDMEKEYLGEFTLGYTTPSYDLETDKEFISDCSHLTSDNILNATRRFIGDIDQIPPAFSAVRIEGQRAYKKARKGEVQLMYPRRVRISTFLITKIEIPVISFRVVCSKGTYIRSLAYDFGQELGVGAFLSKLERVRIGSYKLSDSNTIKEICPS